ncbi:MAG: hypothetical protein IJW23_13435 [Lentisphaeria bacterium]|nr:hypothetical protein [Lentisphaeria bacterium]
MAFNFQNVKLFLYDKLVEAALYYGIFPEVEGGLLPREPKDLRLRCAFRNFEMAPAADSENILSGSVIAEVLYEPGKFEAADFLMDQIIKVFSPGNGEIKNKNCRILTSSAKLLEQKPEGKYIRAGVVLEITVWGADEH